MFIKQFKQLMPRKISYTCQKRPWNFLHWCLASLLFQCAWPDIDALHLALLEVWIFGGTTKWRHCSRHVFSCRTRLMEPKFHSTNVITGLITYKRIISMWYGRIIGNKHIFSAMDMIRGKWNNYIFINLMWTDRVLGWLQILTISRRLLLIPELSE